MVCRLVAREKDKKRKKWRKIKCFPRICMVSKTRTVKELGKGLVLCFFYYYYYFHFFGQFFIVLTSLFIGYSSFYRISSRFESISWISWSGVIYKTVRTCLKIGMEREKKIIYMYLSFFYLVCKGNRNRKQKWEFFFFINILVKQREGWKLMDEGVILWATKKLKNIYIKKKKKNGTFFII